MNSAYSFALALLLFCSFVLTSLSSTKLTIMIMFNTDSNYNIYTVLRYMLEEKRRKTNAGMITVLLDLNEEKNSLAKASLHELYKFKEFYPSISVFIKCLDHFLAVF